MGYFLTCDHSVVIVSKGRTIHPKTFSHVAGGDKKDIFDKNPLNMTRTGEGISTGDFNQLRC